MVARTSRTRFPALLVAIPSITERLVWVLIERNREYTRAEEQIGKLSALSKLAGNLAHELNNPASAVRSAVLTLDKHSDSPGSDIRYRIGMGMPDQKQLDRYMAGLNELCLRIRTTGNNSTSLLQSELEESLSAWLQGRDFADAWKLAPILAEAEVSIPRLQEFVSLIPSALCGVALQDLLETLSNEAAIGSIVRVSERIFRIVTAVKDYSYMDRQPLQDIDLRHTMDIVLTMFQPRLKDVVVKKDIASDVPLFQGFGSELNQAFSFSH